MQADSIQGQNKGSKKHRMPNYQGLAVLFSQSYKLREIENNKVLFLTLLYPLFQRKFKIA